MGSTKTVFALILCLQCLISTGAGQRYYSIASISIARSEQLSTTEYCSVYDASNTQLPSTYWSPGYPIALVNNNTDGCLDEEMLGSMEGRAMVVFVNENCSAYNTSLIGQSLNASMVVLVADYIYDWINVSITVPVLQVSNFTGNEIEMKLDRNSTVYIRAYEPPPVSFDPNILVLGAIAVATVCLGSVLANMPCAFLRRGLLYENDGYWTKIEQAGNKQAEKKKFIDLTKKEKRKVVLVLCCTLWTTLIFTGALAASIFMLYIHYNTAVYVWIGGYGVLAIFALYSTLSPFVASIPYINGKLRLPPNKIPILRHRPGPLFFLTYLLSIGIVVWWIAERNSLYGWALHAVLGFAVCTVAYKFIRFVKKPWLIAVLMVLLIFSDVFLVFGTRLLTNDGRSAVEHYALGSNAGGSTERLPILFWVISFIYPTRLDTVCGIARSANLLGFGDVLIPGMLVVLALKHDLTVRAEKKFKLYFCTISIAYIVGLALTFLVLYFSGIAQPALLYLVPTTVGSMVILSLINKEFRLFFNPKVKKPDTEANNGPEADTNESQEQQNQLTETDTEKNESEEQQNKLTEIDAENEAHEGNGILMGAGDLESDTAQLIVDEESQEKSTEIEA